MSTAETPYRFWKPKTISECSGRHDDVLETSWGNGRVIWREYRCKKCGRHRRNRTIG